MEICFPIMGQKRNRKKEVIYLNKQLSLVHRDSVIINHDHQQLHIFIECIERDLKVSIRFQLKIKRESSIWIIVAVTIEVSLIQERMGWCTCACLA